MLLGSGRLKLERDLTDRAVVHDGDGEYEAVALRNAEAPLMLVRIHVVIML